MYCKIYFGHLFFIMLTPLTAEVREYWGLLVAITYINKGLHLAHIDKISYYTLNNFVTRHKSILLVSCPHTEVQAAHHIYIVGSTYIGEKADIRGSSTSISMHLMSSRTHLSNVIMDSYTLPPSSELFSICSKANMTLKLLKHNQ